MRKVLICAVMTGSLFFGYPAAADIPPGQDVTTTNEDIAPGIICQPTCPKPHRTPVKRRFVRAYRRAR